MWNVRRLVQVFALLLVILTGSLPGLRLLGPAQAEPCGCGMPADTCPMKMPVRSPGSVPCTPGPVAPASLPAAPQVAQAPAADARREPSPFPQASRVSAARLLASGPSVLARPGPEPPFQACPTLAQLSVLRI
jgi:hypothetical protein